MTNNLGPRPVSESLADAVAWFRSIGLVALKPLHFAPLGAFGSSDRFRRSRHTTRDSSRR
jgi:hypothetical protein